MTESEGRRENQDVEGNQPARVGSWRIYQVGYDTARGRWSAISVLECVRDPWYAIAQAALWLMLAAGAAMFVTAGGRRAAEGAPKKGKEVVR